MLPQPVFDPPFNVTRMSHVVLTVPDLAACRHFYTEVIGLVVSDEDAHAIYLRGLEETCHHSLVLRRAHGEPVCQRIGFRVLTEADLDRAATWFVAQGRAVHFVDAPFQRRTLHTTDPSGLPIELVAHMDTRPRLYTDWANWKGGFAHRMDHTQVQVPDVVANTQFWMRMGFRISEYMALDDQLIGAFLFRKGDTQDIVFLPALGPRLHHFAYTVPESRDLFRACDIAGNLGFGDVIDRGPGRHGPSGALFVYFRDPAGHRVELFLNHYQIIDAEVEPLRWDARDQALALRWGMPPLHKWFAEATKFEGVPVADPPGGSNWYTLEKKLQEAAGV